MRLIVVLRGVGSKGAGKVGVGFHILAMHGHILAMYGSYKVIYQLKQRKLQSYPLRSAKVGLGGAKTGPGRAKMEQKLPPGGSKGAQEHPKWS